MRILEKYYRRTELLNRQAVSMGTYAGLLTNPNSVEQPGQSTRKLRSCKPMATLGLGPI